MCSCPRAAITNCHRTGGLEQNKCILSQFWRPKVEISITGPKSRCPKRCASSEGSREICSLPIATSCGCCHSLTCKCLYHFNLYLHCHIAFSSTVCVFLSVYVKFPFASLSWGHIGMNFQPTLIFRDNIPYRDP